MTRLLCAIAAICAASLSFGARPAQASLQLCNQTSYVLYAAVGYRASADTVTQGWTRVIPGDCQTVLPSSLTAPAYFLYARSSQAHTGAVRAWGGNVPLCVKDPNFSLKTPAGASSCTADDAFTVPFAPLDTHASASWTTTLTEASVINSSAVARDVGISRLLNDLGYKFADRKARDEALNRFRARLKIASNASTADLFDALETEAMKASSPAGYSICNDTNGVLWTALTLALDKSTVTTGWWKVPPQGCSHAITQALKADKVFVHADGHNKPGLVSGPAKFCVADITFQTSDSGNCAAHGLKTVGFAVTNTKNLVGYTAHIGDGGLEPDQSVTPK